MSVSNEPAQQIFGASTLLDPDFSRTPHPYYRHLRDDNPVFRTSSLFGGDGTTVYLSRHDDVDFALHHPELFSNELGFDHADQWLVPLQFDPPEHRKYRRLLDPMFSARNMRDLEGDITRRVNELIDAFIDRGECDFAAEVAVALPASMFMRLMGLPLDHAELWLDIKEKMERGTPGATDMSHEDPMRIEGQQEFKARFDELIEERRREPRDDVLTAVLNMEIDGEPVGHDELLGICRLLFQAGLDTVTDSLTCFFVFLANNPGHRRRLIDEPDIIPMAVEEMLRYETPAPWVPRTAKQDIEINGEVIKQGEQVVLLVGSADTDERAYERVDDVDFDRPNIKHFAFGAGVHRCLGMHLARHELRITLQEWHRRIPEYHIPEGTQLDWAPVMRQVMRLPLVFDEVVA